MQLKYTYTPHLQYIQSKTHLESSRTSAVELFCGNKQRIKVVGYFCRRAPSWMSDRILNATLPNNSAHLHQILVTFSKMFGNIPRNVWWHSAERLRTFSGMFWEHFLECLRRFGGMFGYISRNIWQHSPKCLATSPRMFSNILRNVWGHSLVSGNKPTCYKYADNPSCIDLILTNCPDCFQNSSTFETGLSDFYKLIPTLFKSRSKHPTLYHTGIKHFDSQTIESVIFKKIEENTSIDFETFKCTIVDTLDKYALLKRANHSNFVTKELSKATMNRSRLRD